MSAPTTVGHVPGPRTSASEALPTDLLRDTLVHEGLAESLNALLEATASQEQRRPLALNAFGQWCTRDVYGGWQPHVSYMHAWFAAHAEDLA